MPDPLKYDNKEDFVKACVPVVMGEGKTQDEALGQCYGMWDNKEKMQAEYKTEDGIEYPSEAFLYVPDRTKPSTWKLRIWESLDKKVTQAQLGRAAAAFSPGGFRGQKVDLPSDEVEKVKNKLVSEYKKLGVKEEDIPEYLLTSKMKINTVELNDIEISREGKYNASTGNIEITEKTHDDFINNYKNKITNPYLNLDHNDKMTNKIKEALKVLRLGTVKNLYKKGKSLYASFKDVPEKIADMVKAGLLSQRSIEFSKKFKRMDTIYDNVLRGVSFFGIEEPAIPGLEDYVDIFAQVQEDENEVISIMKNSTKEMNTMEIEKKEYEELVKAKAEKELNEIKLSAEISTKEKLQAEYKNSIEKLQNELSEEKQKVEKLEKEKIEVEKMKADYEAEKEVDLQKEAGKYVNEFLGKTILPKFKDKFIGDYVRCSKEGEESLKLFKEDVESRGKVIDLSNKIDPSVKSINDEMEKMTVDDPEKVNEYMDELNTRIEAQMKKLKLQGVEGDLFQKARSIVMGE